MAVLDPLGTIIPRFSEEELTFILDWFDENAQPLLTVNDEITLNAITVEQCQTFLKLKKFHKRSFIYPTYGEIMTQLEAWKMQEFKLFTKEQFLCFLDKWVIEPDLRHEIILAFKVFDTEKRDFLDIEELETALTDNGTVPLMSHEVIELLRDVNVKGDGQIYYENTVDSMLSVTPELAKMKVDYLYEDPSEDPSVEPDPEPEPEPEPIPVEPPPPPPEPPKKEDKGKGKGADKGKKKK